MSAESMGAGVTAGVLIVMEEVGLVWWLTDRVSSIYL